MNVIEARELTRVFGKTCAVDTVTVDVPQGAICGLLGPNGAGKSTLLKLLVGHLRPTSGSATVLGGPASKSDSARWARMGYVSQERYLPGWMTAAELLRFTRALHARWDEAKVARLIERLEFPVDTKIRELSRGHYVRLQIAIALAHSPELILLDEPTSGLDPVGRHALLTLLVEEITLPGRTIVFSSHLVEDIERMADTVAILDAGRIVASGPIDTIKGSRRRVEFKPSANETDLSAVPGLIELKRGPDRMTAITSEPENAIRFLHSRGVADAAVVSSSLEQVFFDYVNRRQP